MITVTTEEIAVRVWQMLNDSVVKDAITGVIDYERNDYSKEDVIIIPRTSDGEKSLRFGQINVNIHVPDLQKRIGKGIVYRINYPRLIELRAMVIEVLQSHYEVGSGWNWTIGQLQPPFKEENHDEHFVTLNLEITIRQKKQT